MFLHHMLKRCSVLKMHGHASGEGRRGHADVVTSETKLAVFVWALELVDDIGGLQMALVFCDVVPHDQTTDFGVLVVNGELKPGVRLFTFDVFPDDAAKDTLIDPVGW